MKVLIITNPYRLSHQYLCSEIANEFELLAVLNPIAAPSKSSAWRPIRQRIQRFGVLYALLGNRSGPYLEGYLSRFSRRCWNHAAATESAMQRYFPSINQDYNDKVAPLVRNVVDINGPATVDMISKMNPDVVVCCGGPVYKRPIVEASRLMLNYHTGISPIYNGHCTAFWAYANGHPHLVGGTLMVMNTVVDGGNILAHYLPGIEATDDPASLFMKCMIGGTELYRQFLRDLSAGKPITSVPQKQPLHYYKGEQWTVVQNIAIAHHIDNKICEKFKRPEEYAQYWGLPDEISASTALKANLARWCHGW